MDTQVKSQCWGRAKLVTDAALEEEVVSEARRLRVETLSEEAERWLQIGVEAARALERRDLSRQQVERLRSLSAECTARLKAIEALRGELAV